MKTNTMPRFLPRNIALLAMLIFGLFCTALHAREYGRYDLKQLVHKNEPPATGAKLNISYLDRFLADLSQHAGNYPPQFDTAEDAQRAQQDVITLMGMLGATFATGQTPPELMLRMGLLGAIGHNLDAPGGAAYAQSQFAQLLKANPEHAAGNYHYGIFLVGTARPKEALPYLLKAKEKGVIPALYGLGMTYLTLGETAKAVESLQDYQKAEPRDTSVEKLLVAIRAGKVETQKAAAR